MCGLNSIVPERERGGLTMEGDREREREGLTMEGDREREREGLTMEGDREREREREGLTMEGDPDTPAPSWIPASRKHLVFPSWMPPARLEDDSWLDKEIEQEDDERMKNVLIEVKQSMRELSNETKREYISDKRKRIVEWKQYTNDMNTTQGFEVGVYPYLPRKLCGSFITRYYYPPYTTITDFELDELTLFANLAIAEYNITQGKDYSNVLVIKAMRSASRWIWYYLTFQATSRIYPPETFEAKIYDDKSLNVPFLQFVRRKIMYNPN